MMLKCCFTSTETVGLLGTGGQDVHLSSVRDIGFVGLVIMWERK